MKSPQSEHVKTNSTIHIVIFADEYYQSQNHLQIDTMKCYSKKKRLRLHIFGLNNTAECNHSINFHRRHCLLAEIMRTRVYIYNLGWAKKDPGLFYQSPRDFRIETMDPTNICPTQ